MIGRHWLICLIGRAIGMTAVLAAAPGGAAPADDDSLAARVEQAQQQNDCAATLQHLREPLDKGLSGGLSAPEYDRYLPLGIRCAAQLDNPTLALRWSETALERDLRDEAGLRLYFWASLRLERYDLVVRAIQLYHDGFRAALNRIETYGFIMLDDKLVERGLTSQRLAMLAILSDDSYVPEDSLGDAQAFRYRYADLLVAEGRGDEARLVASNIHAPWLLLRMTLDPDLRSLVPQDFDMRSATERHLETARLTAARHPYSLQAVLNVEAELRALGRPEEALAVLQAAERREGGLAGFADADRTVSWWWNAKSHVHRDLGEPAAMEAALRQGADTPERGSANISQTLNLAGLLINIGRPRAVLETLERLDPANLNDFASMLFRSARACALHQIGRTESAMRDLAVLKGNPRVGGGRPLMIGQLCLGDMDAAAATLIARIDNPDTRTLALIELAEYLPSPIDRAATSPVEKALQQLKRRADVIAALERHGGQMRIPLRYTGN